MDYKTNKLPCINCITLASCHAQAVPHSYVGTVHNLVGKCELLLKYVKEGGIDLIKTYSVARTCIAAHYIIHGNLPELSEEQKDGISTYTM